TGEADLYPRLGRTMEWDTAAGDAVLRGAGGEVVRFDDHVTLTYGKAGFENPFFIAYAPGVLLVKYCLFLSSFPPAMPLPATRENRWSRFAARMGRRGA